LAIIHEDSERSEYISCFSINKPPISQCAVKMIVATEKEFLQKHLTREAAKTKLAFRFLSSIFTRSKAAYAVVLVHYLSIFVN